MVNFERMRDVAEVLRPSVFDGKTSYTLIGKIFVAIATATERTVVDAAIHGVTDIVRMWTRPIFPRRSPVKAGDHLRIRGDEYVIVSAAVRADREVVEIVAQRRI